MQDKTLDVTIELAKNEIVNCINEVSAKHHLPFCLLNIITSNIANEVNNRTQQELQKNMNNYLESQKQEQESKVAEEGK